MDRNVLVGAETMAALDLALTELRKLSECGLLESETLGRTTLFNRGQVERLATLPSVTLPTTVPTLVVRMGAPDVETGSGRSIGWDDSRTEDEKRAAVSRWWRVKWPDRYIGGMLVATVAGLVVGAWKVGPTIERDKGLIAFDLHDPDSEHAGLYLDHWLRLPPGPVTIPLLPE